MSPEALDRQMRRAYPVDRLPGLGLDRNALGQTGRRRAKDGRCVECGEPILGRAANAATCLLHRAQREPLTRSGLVAVIEEHKLLLKHLEAALLAMDEEVAG